MTTQNKTNSNETSLKKGSNRAQEKLKVVNTEGFRKKVKRGIEQLKVFKNRPKLTQSEKRTMKELSMPMEGNGKDRK